MKTMLLLAVVLLVGGAGCGTMENLVTKEKDGGPRVYGGVKADFQACQAILQEDPHPELHRGTKPLVASSKAVRFCMRVVDMPISTVGDTLTIAFALGGRSGDATVSEPREETDE